MENILKIFNNSKVQAVHCKVTCPICKGENSVRVDREGMLKYAGGAQIQVAFPNLSASERELLQTGICDPCWNKTMKDPDDN